ncbi:MAG: HAD hydrolase-like protein [Pseudomonadota bacterium]
MTLQAVCFDLDGTLTDPQVGITRCIAHALQQLREPVPEIAILKDWIGAPLHRTFQNYLGSSARADEALRLYRDRFKTAGMFENELFDGMHNALGAVRERADSLFVVTSKPRPFAEQIVQHFGLVDYFDGVYGSEFDGRFAEKPALLAHVVAREAFDVASAAMVGDRRYDICAAAAHGIRSVGVLWGFGERDELEAAGADALCDVVLELPGVLFALDSEP